MNKLIFNLSNAFLAHKFWAGHKKDNIGHPAQGSDHLRCRQVGKPHL
jgi:hypothetical protein